MSSSDMEKEEMKNTLKEHMMKITPLPDEPDFTTSDETLMRYLKGYEWKIQDAEKALLETIEYRRMYQPLRTHCKWCYEKPGYHSMRQVGNDASGRPVVYANFAQAMAQKNSLEDVISHVTYLIENAKVTMKPGVTTWVFFIDCSGMTLGVCSPKVGLKTVNLLSAHYPERLGLIICVNHNPLFHAFWTAIKKFLAPTTASKMKMLRNETKMRQTFSNLFPDDLSAWVWEEITANKNKPLIPAQQNFWEAPAKQGEHDPRGCPSYVEEYINNFSASKMEEFVPGEKKTVHFPHPNIAVPPGTTPSVTKNGSGSANANGGLSFSDATLNIKCEAGALAENSEEIEDITVLVDAEQQMNCEDDYSSEDDDHVHKNGANGEAAGASNAGAS